MNDSPTRARWSTRKLFVAMATALAAVVALGFGTANASSASSGPMAGMSGMTMSGSALRGTTQGWLDGHTVTFLYTKNYVCQQPPASMATSRCEGGSLYTQTPASTFDPLYVVVPLGFTPPAGTLQCPTAGRCIDHPSTIDLSAVLGSGTSNIALPAHSHIIATANSNQAEWWPVVVVGVTKAAAWKEIVEDKNLSAVQKLQRDPASGVTGNIATNVFLYFKVLPH